MTTWIEEPGGGRDRGAKGIVRAWVEVLVRPRRFFRNGVAPGDQAPGLVFADVVAVAYLLGRYGADPGSIPAVAGGRLASAALVLLATVVVVVPATLHLTAALQTVLLIPVVPDRAGVSETVQVVAYAGAPLAVAGAPVPWLRVLAAGYAAVLLVVGLRTVHGTSLPRAAVAGAIPATLLFGVVAGGIEAGRAVL